MSYASGELSSSSGCMRTRAHCPSIASSAIRSRCKAPSPIQTRTSPQRLSSSGAARSHWVSSRARVRSRRGREHSRRSRLGRPRAPRRFSHPPPPETRGPRRGRGRRGQAVLIASVSGRWPDASGPGYQATKAGVRALAHGLAFEEHTNGVRVCAILPGAINTAFIDKRPVAPTPEVRAKMLHPEDIAAACLFVVTLRPGAYVPELVILPTDVQAIGRDLTR